MKKIVALFLLLSVLAVMGLASVASPVFADGGHGALRVGFSSSPRFPIAGEEATLSFTVSFIDGTPGSGQEVMVMMMRSETGGHAHGGEEAQAPAEAGHDMAGMAGMNHGAEEAEPTPMIHLMPEEVSPGVYEAKVTFEQGGRYVATVNVLGDEVDVTVGVRSSPVAWWYVGALAGISALLAGAVAVAKTVRRAW